MNFKFFQKCTLIIEEFIVKKIFKLNDYRKIDQKFLCYLSTKVRSLDVIL